MNTATVTIASANTGSGRRAMGDAKDTRNDQQVDCRGQRNFYVVWTKLQTDDTVGSRNPCIENVEHFVDLSFLLT